MSGENWEERRLIGMLQRKEKALEHIPFQIADMYLNCNWFILEFYTLADFDAWNLPGIGIN